LTKTLPFCYKPVTSFTPCRGGASNNNMTNYEVLRRQIYDGLEFMLKHELWNTAVSDRMFPRTVATGATKRKQYVVDSKETALAYYKASLYEDCYLNAYPDYEELKRIGVITQDTIKNFRYNHKPIPQHLVIDLDRDNTMFATDEEFQAALDDTLKNIRTFIYGDFGRCPTVIWTGNGYHIHVVLNNWYDAVDDMHDFQNFKELGSEELANKFMRWAERRLSNNKSDPHHNMSIKSAMFRIPGTINTKSKAAGRDSIVKIVQSWALTDVFGNGGASQKLLDEFHSYLTQERIDTKVEKLERDTRRHHHQVFVKSIGIGNDSDQMLWIDKILQTAVEDNRKNLLFWVLAPYLVTVRKMSYDKAYSVLTGWLERCAGVRRLEPDWTTFRYRLRYCLEAAEQQQRKPIKFETFKEYYPELYKELFPAGRYKPTGHE
jgi:Primase X